MAPEVGLGEPSFTPVGKTRPRIKRPPKAESGLDSREGIVARLKELCEAGDTKPDVLLKALRQICEIRGFAAVPELGEYRHMSNEKLTALMFDVVLTALSEFGVRDSQLLQCLCPKCKETLKKDYLIELDAAVAE